MSREIVLDPKTLSKRELAALKRQHRRLAELAGTRKPAPGKAETAMTVRLSTGDAEEDLALPPSLASALAAALVELADGHAVHITPVAEELTTNEAADLLNVSRPFLIKLLEDGAIPHRKVGTHRRVRREDVLAYKETMYQDADKALQELADQAQELGLGYE